MLKSFIRVFAAWTACGGLAMAAEKSELLAPGSGYYAQILLGNQAIKPIRFKADSIATIADANCAGLTIQNSAAAGQFHISGNPSTDSCSASFSVNGSPITVEFFRLPTPPAKPEADALLATLPKVAPFSAIYITSKVPARFSNTVWDKYVDLDEEEKLAAGNGATLLKNVSFDFLPVRQQDLTRYKSCKFEIMDKIVWASFEANKVGQLDSDSAVESCQVDFYGLSAELSAEEQPPVRTMINYFVVKSYL